MNEHKWHRLMLEDGRPVYSGATSDTPKRGVWMRTADSQDGGQSTIEVIAVDGVEVERRACMCGHDRHRIFQAAGQLLIARKRKL